MKNSEITQLLKEQPKSYLQNKDRNKFDDTDLYNLKHGNLTRTEIKHDNVTPKARVFKIESDFSIDISRDGIVTNFTSVRQIADFYEITYATAKHIINQGRSKKHRLICKTK